LKKGTKDRNSFLIGEDRALLISEGKETIKTILENVGVLGMFVKNKPGNLDIADFAIEDSSFAQNINTLDVADVFEHFLKNVVGIKAKRVVNIDNKTIGIKNFIFLGNFETRVELGGFDKSGKRDNLSVDVEIMGRGNGIDFEFLLIFLEVLMIGRGHKTGGVVEKIGRMEVEFLFLDFMPNIEKVGVVLREMTKN